MAIDPEQMAALTKEVYGWKLRIGPRRKHRPTTPRIWYPPFIELGEQDESGPYDWRAEIARMRKVT
jgi:hypothetical protein